MNCFRISHNYNLVTQIKGKGPERTREGVGEAEKNHPTKSRKFRQKQKGITGRDRDVHPKVVSLNDFSAVIINKANIRKAGINDE